ncbi:MAG: hypothetical protein ACR2GN_01345, partial [Bacteroidia bacterium]
CIPDSQILKPTFVKGKCVIADFGPHQQAKLHSQTFHSLVQFPEPGLLALSLMTRSTPDSYRNYFHSSSPLPFCQNLHPVTLSGVRSLLIRLKSSIFYTFMRASQPRPIRVFVLQR